MKKSVLLSSLLLTANVLITAAQPSQKMTPELLWKLGRFGSGIITPDEKNIIYSVSTYNMGLNKAEPNLFSVPVTGGPVQQLTNEPGSKAILKIDALTGRVTYWYDGRIWQMDSDGGNLAMLTVNQQDDFDNIRISPDGKKIMYTRDVQIQKVLGKDRYADLPKATAYVITDLNYRHWDTWSTGKFSHVFLADYDNGKISNEKDIMHGEAFDTPQKPAGGLEDLIFSPDSKQVLYVCKKKSGKDYAQSTNTGLYQYTIATDETRELTQGMNGYDTQPSFSHDGNRLAWLSMKEDGYEADKNDIIIKDIKTGIKVNLTAKWDESISSFTFSKDDSKIYFIAVHNGTEQLFSVDVKKPSPSGESIVQITKGQWDVTSIIGQSGNQLLVTRTDMNHAAEIYSVNLPGGNMHKLSDINDKAYNKLMTSRVDERHIKTTDGKDMLAWVIYPPDFDPTKKYPTLLYCQGGPQSALSQFYSFRWNFQLMAAQGYIVIAPNRRGMPGHGVEWNREISGDWGGQPIQDYLSAIDDIAKEPFVDKERLGCVGASYGGYSVYMLAGVHEGRFKTFIAHDGLFDLKSWYGTTEELWFANKDIGGNYWDKSNMRAQRSYSKFNPSNYVDKWNTPIMIIQGGKDYRVPIEQGLQAFQAAQLRGIKSKLIYLPDENHWVLKPQNAILWQREFFDWLKETL
ncbi:S9 family peptidase [Mucilaginibacter paludis]|uniref:Peptidase S9 prolyl oligopeptidase active site domain protein n=1 Tax=Mucilaginibacter paludis DSM 18603 TaxID=714943 RepID=H1Y578_9SPHI|nr:S9 family peptidase [Mucilaginibacter paludis]EHQ28621.1 peptidase S9 prolyl oligopeptidase active site domain protein [Mucilaginibacter paludis DSM 18603]